MVNTRFSGEWPEKEVASAHSSKVKKRKLSDMVSRWSNEELKQFYEALRKHGTNWKKVARAIHNRSVDMVEQLYNLNRAYLSLPEGTATEDGFLAMMSDHYDNLDESDSDHESNGPSKKSLKVPKCARGKSRPVKSKGSNGYNFNMQIQSARSSYKCTSKKYFGASFCVNWPHVVRRRTPRIPVNYDQAGIDDTFWPRYKIINGVTSLIGDSPLESGTPGMTELIQSVKVNHAIRDMATPSSIGLRMDDSCLEGILGRTEANEEVPVRKNGESVHGSRKKSCLSLPEDEDSALSPLEMLAYVSSQTASQASLVESVPAVHVIEQNNGDDSPNNPSEPGALSAKPEADNLKISVKRDGRHSSFSSHRSNVPGSITGEKSLIKVHRDIYSPNFIVDGVPLNEAQHRNRVFPNIIGNAFSEEKRESCGDISDMQQTSADRQILEVEICNNSCLDEFQKNEDIDCMPINLCEHMPGDARIHEGIVENFCSTFKKSEGCVKEFEMENSESLAILPEQPLEPIVTDFSVALTSSQNLDTHGCSLSPSSELTPVKSMNQIQNFRLAKDASSEELAATSDSLCNQTWMQAQIKSKEYDIKAIVELTRALDKKEAILEELKHINDQVSRKTKGGELTVDDKHVREQYSPFLKLLNEASDEVTKAVCNIRQRNTYNHSCAPQWFRSLEKSAVCERPAGIPIAEYLMDQELGSQVLEIVSSSKQKAKIMVDAAVLAISSLKEEEDASMIIKEALDSADNQQCAAGVSSPSEAQIPSQLISDSLATIFTIQDASTRRCPPAQVARILENAVESLKPKCSQNLPIYRDIQRNMGYIKTQIFSLVAEPITGLSPKIPV